MCLVCGMIQGSSCLHLHGMVPHNTIYHHDLCRTVGQRPWLTMIAFLQIMFVQRSQWLSLLCLYCMASWWTRYHNDRWGLRSRSRCSHDGAFSVFFFFCEEVRFITIHALSRQVMTTTQPWCFRVAVLMDLMADILRFSLWGLVVVVAMSVLCGTETNELLANGDPHGSHPCVCCSVALPVIVVWLQSRSQWWTLLYLRCMVLWWTPHHHDLWVTLLQKLCLTWFF